MNEREIAWVAGILEGEGCFSYRGPGRPPQISCAMTDKDIIERLQAVTGMGKIYYRQQKDNWKPTWTWMIFKRKDVEALALAIKPWMGERRSAKIQQILDNIRPQRANAAQCGTVSGYYRHRRLDEWACQECRDAHAAAQRERKLRKTS